MCISLECRPASLLVYDIERSDGTKKNKHPDDSRSNTVVVEMFKRRKIRHADKKNEQIRKRGVDKSFALTTNKKLRIDVKQYVMLLTGQCVQGP